MGMKCKEFNDYEKACTFCDKVDGQIYWENSKDKQYWTVWYTDRIEVEDGNITIDSAIQRLQAERNDYRHDTVSNWALSLDMAMNTMRKYQKIQEIINNAKDSDGVVKYNWLYEQIGKVVEDGNDD